MPKLLFILLLIYASSALGQTRTNFQLPKINPVISAQLTTAKGWINNPEGQWISRPNRIPYFIENQHKILIDYERHGLGMDNFIFYQLRKINIYDSTWYILIKKYKDGYYRYPTIKKGWIPSNSYYFFVFGSDELKKLDSIQDGKRNRIVLAPFTQGALEFSNDATFLKDLEKEIAKQLKDETYTEGELIFHIAPYKNKNIVQFQIYGWNDRLSYPPSVLVEHKGKEKIGDYTHDTAEIYNTDSLFDHCYFETDYKSFSNFIKFK
jgi:hypothetical protein